MREFRTASNEYKLGWLGRSPYDLDKWTNPAIADYNAGKADKAKILRQRNRKKVLENIIVGILAFFFAIGAVLVWAFVIAAPFLIVVGFLALIGVI